ncbi:hypothetical protein CC80DRAFT_171637 [Byssothecium circinans]|uniref:Uncharacterized protein n=1 Tax=Byssothecium circinans TaxID=147558 RepID=A0A6A5TLP8_9PLEO|nr:hypothetical protein CC80DRAFT_171637 [Byssothecium circinans]
MYALYDGQANTCHHCTNGNPKALKETPFVYCLVFSTYQARDPYIHGAHFHGHPIHKLLRCGSREAVVAVTSYNVVMNGWALSCCWERTLCEDTGESSGEMERVGALWMLGGKDGGRKVFY